MLYAMKKLYTYVALFVGLASIAQQKDEPKQQDTFPTQLTLAVKQTQGWYTSSLTTPDFSFYNKNYQSVFSGYDYTFNILDEKLNRVYVEGDKYYSNTYIPIVAQQHNSSLAIDNMYMYRTNSAPAVGVNVNALKR